MNRKRFLLIPVVVLLLALLLPFPTRIDQTMHAKLLRSDGGQVKPFEFTMEGWYLNYLVLEDRLKLEFEFPKYPMYLRDTKTVTSLYPFSDDYWCCSYMGTPISVSPEYFAGYFALTKDGEYCIFTLGSVGYCVGSLEPMDNPEDIVERFPTLTSKN